MFIIKIYFYDDIDAVTVSPFDTNLHIVDTHNWSESNAPFKEGTLKVDYDQMRAIIFAETEKEVWDKLDIFVTEFNTNETAESVIIPRKYMLEGLGEKNLKWVLNCGFETLETIHATLEFFKSQEDIMPERYI